MKLAFLAAAWLAGTMLGLEVDPPLAPVALLLLAVLPLALVFRTFRRSVWPALLAGVLLLGLLRVEAAPGAVAPSLLEGDGPVVLVGRISDDPESTARRIRFAFDVDGVDEAGVMRPASAKILVYATPPEVLLARRDSGYFRYGDVLRLEGELRRPAPFNGFDYPAYLANQGISGILYTTSVHMLPRDTGPIGSALLSRVFDLRRGLANRLEQAITEPHVSLAQALLLGLRGALPEDVEESFRRTGTSHLLAISGLHVGVILALTMMATSRLFGRRWHLYLAISVAVVWGYALVSGLPISVVRAAIMGTVLLTAWAVGRPRSVLPSLALAAAVMVGIDPKVLGQVSFQLSFTALAGIVLALPYQARISEWTSRQAASAATWRRAWFWEGSRTVSTALVVSTGATLATWPLVAANFERVPLLGIFTTLLALPALPGILVGSMATALAGLVHPLGGQFFGWLTWAPLSYLMGLVSVFPTVSFSGSWVGTPFLWVWYLTLGGLLLLPGGMARLKEIFAKLDEMWGRVAGKDPDSGTPPGLSLGSAMLAVALLAGGVVLWLQVFSPEDENLRVHFFDVGQGDSTLIDTPGGRQVLVDGGPDMDGAVNALAGSMPPGDRTLDLVVITHMDEDHARGLIEIVDRYEVAAVLMGTDDEDAVLSPQWEAALRVKGIEPVQVASGHLVELEPGIALEVLNPPVTPFAGTPADRNNNSVVMRLSYGRITYLLAADIEAPAESRLAHSTGSLKSTVLKVGHHGSRSSTTASFLEKVDPSLAVVSAGADNRYGHPHREVMDRLTRRLGPEMVFRTDRDGSVELISDGVDLWVKTGKDRR